jgi:hypothetical protein
VLPNDQISGQSAEKRGKIVKFSQIQFLFHLLSSLFSTTMKTIGLPNDQISGQLAEKSW